MLAPCAAVYEYVSPFGVSPTILEVGQKSKVSLEGSAVEFTGLVGAAVHARDWSCLTARRCLWAANSVGLYIDDAASCTVSSPSPLPPSTPSYRSNFSNILRIEWTDRRVALCILREGKDQMWQGLLPHYGV